jgi:hypothetical protein
VSLSVAGQSQIWQKIFDETFDFWGFPNINRNVSQVFSNHNYNLQGCNQISHFNILKKKKLKQILWF